MMMMMTNGLSEGQVGALVTGRQRVDKQREKTTLDDDDCQDHYDNIDDDGYDNQQEKGNLDDDGPLPSFPDSKLLTHHNILGNPQW